MTIQEKNTINIIKKSLPAIVSIEVFKKNRTKKNSLFPIVNNSIKNNHLDGGTGFIIDKTGIIVTNLHIIHHDNLDYEITTYDNKKFKAKLIGKNIINDIAFLKIKSNNDLFHSLKLGNSSNLQLGQNVIAIGNAFGIFKNTVSHGIISGLTRSIQAKNYEIKESLKGLIQIDAAINPGNSGGPLLDSDGKVIGINTAIMSSAQNISFATPINIIKNDLNKIKKFGKLVKPFLGVRYITLDENISQILNIEHKNGAYITSPINKPAIIKNSPAHKAGIKENDIIISINNLQLKQNYTLEDALNDIGINKQVDVEIIRNNKKINKKIFIKESQTMY